MHDSPEQTVLALTLQRERLLSNQLLPSISNLLDAQNRLLEELDKLTKTMQELDEKNKAITKELERLNVRTQLRLVSTAEPYKAVEQAATMADSQLTILKEVAKKKSKLIIKD